MSAHTLHRLLLIEDDTVSARYLVEALSALPAPVDHASSLMAATSLVRHNDYALWLVDANLPDGRGEDWLGQQRTGGHVTPALALTAETDRGRHESLMAAGFVEVLPKPLPIALLHAAVRRCLGEPQATRIAEPIGNKYPVWDAVWDERQALSVLGGDAAAVVALRGLFMAELPGQRRIILDAIAQRDASTARDVLHKLQASTAFVGAARLGRASRDLHRSLDDREALQRFSDAVSDLLDG